MIKMYRFIIISSDIPEAAKLIYSIYKNPVKGKKLKKEYDQNIGLHETFLEAVPTTLVLTVIIVKVAG